MPPSPSICSMRYRGPKLTSSRGESLSRPQPAAVTSACAELPLAGAGAAAALPWAPPGEGGMLTPASVGASVAVTSALPQRTQLDAESSFPVPHRGHVIGGKSRRPEVEKLSACSGSSRKEKPRIKVPLLKSQSVSADRRKQAVAKAP